MPLQRETMWGLTPYFFFGKNTKCSEDSWNWTLMNFFWIEWVKYLLPSENKK